MSLSITNTETYLEIIGANRQELVADVKCVAACYAAKVALATQDAPLLCANVDKDIAAACDLVRCVLHL